MKLGSNIKIVSVGRLVRRKGFHLIIDALKKAPFSYNYKLIGNGPEYDHLLSLSKENQNIEILNSLSDERKKQIMEIADVFVMTPLNTIYDIDGFGIGYLEAIVQQAPISGPFYFPIHRQGIHRTLLLPQVPPTPCERRYS